LNNPGFYVAQKAKRKELSLAAWYPFFQKKRCHPEPFLCPLQRQATTTHAAGIKRVKDLAELLRNPKSKAQGTIAYCLASLFPKKTLSS
jgi:hypothetical protein